MRKIGQLAAVGSVGNNTHASLAVPPDADTLAFEFEITVAGATPTVTFKLQGSQDDVSAPDASSDWFDISMLPAASDTALATDTKTAVGVYEYFIEMARRSVAKLRLVTSANTNVTYEGELHVEEQE
jgi:hypothetical protein